MKMLVLVVLLVLISYIAYECVRISKLVAKSRALVESSRSFQRTDGTFSMLVIGDSTAVGVGGAPNDSLAAIVSTLIDASVQNLSKSGAVVADARSQLAAGERDRYDLILIQVGANNIIRLGSLQTASDGMDVLLQEARKHSDRVILLTSGKVGDAPLFPAFARFYFTKRAENLRESFMKLAEKHDVQYVDLFSAADVFKTDPAKYYASDKFHPSGEGYRVWFEEVRKTIEKNWPELEHAE